MFCGQTSDGNSCDSRDTNANKCMEDNNHVAVNDEAAVTTHIFDFPTEMCGRLIGQRGRNVAVIKEKSGAEIFIRGKRYDTTWQTVTLEGDVVTIFRSTLLSQPSKADLKCPIVRTFVRPQQVSSISNFQ